MTTLTPNFDVSTLPTPITDPEAIAHQLLNREVVGGDGGGGKGARLSPFGPRSYFLANARVPAGHIQITPGQITMIIVGERRSLREFLHRLRSMKQPCKTTFMSGPNAKVEDTNYAYAVQLNELKVVSNQEAQDDIAIAIQLGIIEWIPKAQLPQAIADGEGEGWEELEPIVTACALLREDNRRYAHVCGTMSPKELNKRAWNSAISNVLDYCNRSRLPKSFEVAWSFVTRNLVLITYARERELSDADAVKERMRGTCLLLGEERWRVAEKAIDGYERGLRRNDKVPNAKMADMYIGDVKVGTAQITSIKFSKVGE